MQCSFGFCGRPAAACAPTTETSGQLSRQPRTRISVPVRSFLSQCVPAPLSPPAGASWSPQEAGCAAHSGQSAPSPSSHKLASSALPFAARRGAPFQCLYEQAPLHIARSPRLCIICCVGGGWGEVWIICNQPSSLCLRACNEVLGPFRAPIAIPNNQQQAPVPLFESLASSFALSPRARVSFNTAAGVYSALPSEAFMASSLAKGTCGL